MKPKPIYCVVNNDSGLVVSHFWWRGDIERLMEGFRVVKYVPVIRKTKKGPKNAKGR